MWSFREAFFSLGSRVWNYFLPPSNDAMSSLHHALYVEKYSVGRDLAIS
jgi:hypothetical protein